MSSCTGTGGSANSMGAVYNPDGSAAGSSSGSSGNGGSVSGSSSGSSSTTGSSDSAPAAISADDLHRLANGGLADSITAYFPAGEDETSKTFYLNLSAEDFGVPEDGYMVLAIDSDGFANGGTHWDDTQYISDVDGCAHFMNIPMMQVGSRVTVTLLCYTAGGVLISSGYCSGTVNDDMGIPMEIAILGPPAIVLGTNGAANGSDIVHDGARYDIIEYTGASLSMTAVNTNSDSTMEVTVNDTPVSGTNASVSAVLADGFNTIVSTVRKGDNAPVVITRNIYVVKKLVQPVITLGTNGTPNGKTTASGGKTYQVVEYTGTGLSMTATNGYTGDNAEFTVTVNGNPVSGTTSLVSMPALPTGLNAIVATVTKENCRTVREEKYIYVVKALSEDDIAVSYPGGTHFTADDVGDCEMWKYRYSQVDNLKLTVENNYSGDDANTGAHSSIKVEVDSTVTTWTGGTSVTSTPHVEYTDDSTVEDKDLQDGTHTITITLSKPLCTDVQVVKTITSAMKPIKVYISDGHTHIKFEESGDLTMRGTLHIGVNPHGQYVYAYGGANTSDGCTWLEIRNLANGGDWNGDVDDEGAVDRAGDVYIYNKDDKLCYKTNDLHRANGNPFKGIIKVDFEPNLKSTSYNLWVNVTNDTPQRVGNGANSIHWLYLALDDGY